VSPLLDLSSSLTQEKKKNRKEKKEKDLGAVLVIDLSDYEALSELCGIRCAAVASVFLFGCERLAPNFVGFGFSATEERSRAREMPQMNDPFALQVCVERP
jgi:hypothetical protein